MLFLLDAAEMSVRFEDGRVIIALLEMMPHFLDLILNTAFVTFAVNFLIA